MASAPTVPLVSVEEYLNTSYRPDMEYVDGVLVERGMPTILHGLLQAVVFSWFHSVGKEYGFRALINTRTQVVPKSRYRIPDVLLCEPPIPKGKVVSVTPLAVIEVLSPTDTMDQMLGRFEDYEQIGVRHLLQFDPQRRVMRSYSQGALVPCETYTIRTSKGRELLFDVRPIFVELDKEYDELTTDGIP